MCSSDLLRIGDLAMITTMTRNAQDLGLSLGAYASQAVRQYADGASDEEWTTLIGQMGRSDYPGAVYLKRAFTALVAG